MPRTISGTLSAILAGPTRHIDWTLDVIFPFDQYRFATSTLSGVNGGFYTNELETVSGIRQTLEAPTDTVSVAIQNKDRIMGENIASNWQIWRNAMAVIGRYYTSTDGNQWIEMFRGAVQRPNADDFRVFFDVIPDTVSPGLIVGNRTLGPICPALFKDLKTCGYTGGLTTCNHLLRSPAGCDGRANQHHFMGFEHRYAADYRIPGTGGNDDDPPEIFPPCPRLDQYVRVKGVKGQVIAKMVYFVTDEDEIWNPVLRRFFPIEKCEIVRDQPIWELVSAFGAAGYSSGLHPIIRDINDGSGLAVERFAPRERLLAVADDLVQTSAVIVRKCEQRGDVMRIEMRAENHAEKIYCYGDSPEKMIVCHNRKDDPILLDL